MSTLPKKAAVVGLDCAQPHLIMKHIEEGRLPNFKRLLDNGFFALDCLCPLPTVTPPNWASIATGAWPGTHGVTDFHYNIPGADPDNAHIRQNWSSARLQAETMWEAADRAGLRSVVMCYPGAWPSSMKHGIVVGGQGMTIGESGRDDLPLLDSTQDVCRDFLVSNKPGPYVVKSDFVPAHGWKNAGDLGDEPLECSFAIPSANSGARLAPTRWWILAHGDKGNGLAAVTLAPEKDLGKAFCTLTPGAWSGRIDCALETEDGQSKPVFFACKLLRLNDDASDFALLIGALISTDYAWTNPPGIAEEIFCNNSVSHYTGGFVLYMLGQIDADTYVEMNEHQSDWLAAATETLLKNHPWDLYYLHSHPIDWMYHGVISAMDSADEKTRTQAWEIHRRIYEVEDRLLGRLLKAFGEDTLVCVVSDHGATPDGPTFNPFDALVPAGLATMREDAGGDAWAEGDGGEVVARLAKAAAAGTVDYAKTRAVPQREIHVRINLKGREPHGIVEPADYASVQQEIIDALLTYRDPATGARPVALALTIEDARMLGLYGERCGDVIYAIKPEYGSQHGPILPTARSGVGRLNSLLMLHGPGIKKGARLERPCRLIDLVPTICFLTGLPFPRECEGAVLFAALEEPQRLSALLRGDRAQ